MTTFKNNSKYAELVFLYLDVAIRCDNPLTVPEVLRTFRWRFKGGSLREAAERTRLQPETSGDIYPDGYSGDIADQWPDGREAQALARVLRHRARESRMRTRACLSRVATYQLLKSSYGLEPCDVQAYTGMRAIYHLYGRVWDWAPSAPPEDLWCQLDSYIKEMVVAGAAVSRVHVPTAEANRMEFVSMLGRTRVRGLFRAVRQAKELIRLLNGGDARTLARLAGAEERERWGPEQFDRADDPRRLTDQGEHTRFLRCDLGPVRLKVSQGIAVLGAGPLRYALGKSDVERLHQVLMSTVSALVGVCAQACVGTRLQKQKACLAVGVAESNLQRIVDSSRRVPLGDEVLVCKGYRRAYTAHLGVLAGGLCRREAEGLVQEAMDTAAPGVLDVEGFLRDSLTVDAASSLNAAKMFKVCPAPDVSPGAAMMDRIAQIGNCNVTSNTVMAEFKDELRSQILRAHIRHHKGRLSLRSDANRPIWMTEYLMGQYDRVPSAEIHRFLAWEGTAEFPDVSPHDPANWKDSGLGADTIQEAESDKHLGPKANMITRLLFDSECPMPGRRVFSAEHVIKFFIKAEGHKDPARGIFSANLTDRQAQSWMERGVDSIARHHPAYMIGQPVDVKEERVIQLTSPPARAGWVALYYSFDISGWSAKMPAEPQRISHSLWGELFGESLYRSATTLNEGAYIYLKLDGYRGWYRNTCSNLEGFNGKEMTMVLVALLSLSVRKWRERVVPDGLLTQQEALATSALLFAYIDDGLSRIDLPRAKALGAFNLYKQVVIETFQSCGFSVEVTKCFPSDRFAIFLNEVYLGGRHVVHGVRAAMAIGSEATERHTSLIERVSSVSTGCRGAVMAGLNPESATILMAYHTFLHLLEWSHERDPVVLAAWSYTPRTWGGLGLPNMLQLFTSGSGAAFEEGLATLQAYARLNKSVRKVFTSLCRTELDERDEVGTLVAPLSGRVVKGYMVDSRVAVYVRRALKERVDNGDVSNYARRLLRYADEKAFRLYAEAIVPLNSKEVLQEQMLINVAEAHPHSVFSAFARRLEKSMTVLSIVGRDAFTHILRDNREDVVQSLLAFREHLW